MNKSWADGLRQHQLRVLGGEAEEEGVSLGLEDKEENSRVTLHLVVRVGELGGPQWRVVEGCGGW